VLYATPGKRLSLRGTWGTSFQAPTLNQRFVQRSGFSGSINDPLTPQNDNLSRVLTDTNGDPSLKPQTSTAYNFGATVRLLDNLKLDLDYWHYKFEDLVATENAQAVVNAFPTDPTRVQRDNNNGIIRIRTQFFNAAAVETAGLDIGLTHMQELGRFGRERQPQQPGVWFVPIDRLAGQPAHELGVGQSLRPILADLHRRIRQRSARRHRHEIRPDRLVHQLGPVVHVPPGRVRQLRPAQKLRVRGREQRDEEHSALYRRRQPHARHGVRL
jgi:hypothetical protein